MCDGQGEHKQNRVKRQRWIKYEWECLSGFVSIHSIEVDGEKWCLIHGYQYLWSETHIEK